MVANAPPIHLGVYQRGAVPPGEVVTFTDGAGAAIPITGYTVTFEWWANDDPATPSTATGSIVDGAAGTATWPWETVLDDPPGRYTGRLKVSDGSNVLVAGPWVWVLDDPTGAGLPS